MAANLASPTGPVYPLGKFAPTAGTVLPLSTNVKVTDSFGTPAAGIPGLTTTGSLAPLKCNQIKVMAHKANAGHIFLVIKSQPAATAPGNSVILVVPPGTERIIESKQVSMAFSLDNYGVDTDNTGDSCWVTAVMA